MTNRDTLLRADSVSYRYHGMIPALDAVSITVGVGDRLAIIGANGSGKSTLLQVLAGIVHPESGSVIFRGQKVSERKLKEKAFLRTFRQQVGYVFQDSDIQLFCPTVIDELVYGPIQIGLSNKEALTRAEEVMSMLSIESLKDRPSYMLSGGEKKKVAIASVLTMNPEILLLDEPTSGLDPRTQVFLMELIFALNDVGKTIVIATHDLSLVGELEATVAVLSEGHRLEKIGTASEILQDDDLLLRVNLIHEHVHSHGEVVHRHRHSHFLFHRH